MLAGVGEDNHSTGVALLTDIRAIFAQRCVDRLRSAELVCGWQPQCVRAQTPSHAPNPWITSAGSWATVWLG